MPTPTALGAEHPLSPRHICPVRCRRPTYNTPRLTPSTDHVQPVVTLDVVDNIRRAYAELEHSIFRALQTQIGDGVRLSIERDTALRLLETAEPVRLLSCHNSLSFA